MKVAFIADNRIPGLKFGVSSWFRGVSSTTGAGLMRAGWIIDANRDCYEWYRPGRRYDALIFVKSFSRDCLELAEKKKKSGNKIFFDINVNYFESDGAFYYDGMAPSPEQQRNAATMLSLCHGAMAASEELRDLCEKRGSRTVWIPDHVDLRLVPLTRQPSVASGRLSLLWCGQAIKLFELLLIEEVIRMYRDKLTLSIVSGDIKESIKQWNSGLRKRWENLMADISVQFIPYVSIVELLRYYSQQPGILISPRFLDNSYNRSHTAWKIILGMSCGRFALASGQRSYKTVASRAGGHGIRICETPDDWAAALEALLSGAFDWSAEEEAAAGVVRRHYSTAKIAADHRRTLDKWILDGGE